MALGATYFVAVSALDITTNVGTIDDLTSTARIALVLPVAILDAIFILWVFTSLSKTLSQLQVGCLPISQHARLARAVAQCRSV